MLVLHILHKCFLTFCYFDARHIASPVCVAIVMRVDVYSLYVQQCERTVNNVSYHKCSDAKCICDSEHVKCNEDWKGKRKTRLRWRCQPHAARVFYDVCHKLNGYAYLEY